MRAIKSSIRKHIQSKRKQLSDCQRHHLSLQICQVITQQPYFIQAQRIAFYHPLPDEVSLLPLLTLALRLQKSCFLPIVENNNLRFAKIKQDTPLLTKAWGILEPQATLTCDPQSLDLVLTPLVAFDAHCHRLGMGKGYYDRCFSFRVHRSKPLLVGVAFELQRVGVVPTNQSDLVLDRVVTERKQYARDAFCP